MDTKDASHLDSRETLPTGAVSRRAALRGIGGVGIATALGIAAPGRTGAAASTASVPAIEPKAGSWKTWILSAGDQLRPAAPPDEAATKAELADLTALASDRGTAELDQISYWDAGSPGYRWNEIAMQHTLKAGHGPGSGVGVQ